MVEKAIYNILSTVAALSTVQINFGTLPNMSAGGSYIVFFRNGTTPYDTKSGRSTLDDVSMQCNIYSPSALECANISERVRGTLDRKTGTFAGVIVQSIQFTNQINMFDFNDGFNEKGVYQMAQYYSCRTDPQYL